MSLKIVAIEGIECSGKTTLFKRVKQEIRKTKIILLDELPTKIGNYFPLGTKANIDTEVALMTLTGAMMQQISQELKNGNRVVMDRCWISQIVYSNVRKRMVENYYFDPRLYEVQESVILKYYSGIMKSVGVVFLNINPSESMNRWRSRRRDNIGGHVPSEKWVKIVHDEYQKYVQKSIKSYSYFKIIDAAKNPEEIFEEFKEFCRKNRFLFSSPI